MPSILSWSSTGQAPAAAVPSWFSAANADEWTALSSSTLSTSGVGWSGTSPGGTGNYTGVVKDWSGAVLNTVGLYRSSVFVPGTFLCLWGGGHGDYSGNEIYDFGPLENDAPSWHRLYDPTIPAADDVARTAEGWPVARHTYDTLRYLPTLNKMLSIGAPGAAHTGNSLAASDLLDFAVDPASENPWSSNDTGFPTFASNGTLNLIGDYNPTTGKAWGLGKGNLQKLAVWDVATQAWTAYNKDNAVSVANTKAAIDSANNLLVFVGASGTVYVQDLDSPTSAIYSPTVTGTGPGVATGAIEYDATRERFVFWPGTGKTLYFLTPGADPSSGGDDWAWTSTAPAGGDTPANQTTNGTFGRMRMVNGDLRGVLLMPTYDQPICFWKM